VEGIKKAIDEFRKEHSNFNIEQTLNNDSFDAFDKYVGDKITLLKGNFFHLNDFYSGGKFDMVWDRAAIIAINPKDRETYVNILGNMIKPGGCIITTTIDRAEGNMDEPGTGPPFSINESDIRNIYGNLDWVDSITKLDEGEMDDSFRYELCFSICSKFV